MGRQESGSSGRNGQIWALMSLPIACYEEKKILIYKIEIITICVYIDERRERMRIRPMWD